MPRIGQHKRSARLPGWGVLCLLSLVQMGCDSSLRVFISTPGCEVPADAAERTDDAVALINHERTLRGMKPLADHDGIAQLSEEYACLMIQQQFFGHVDPETGRSLADRHAESQFSCCAMGENLARGYDSAAEVVEAWMDSRSHRDNILEPDYTHIGVGVATNDQGVHYWVLLLVTQPDADSVLYDETTTLFTDHQGDLTVSLSDVPTLPAHQTGDRLQTIRPESAGLNAGERE